MRKSCVVLYFTKSASTDNEDRSPLSKRISVRSSGYSKRSHGGGGGASQCGKPRGVIINPRTFGQPSTTDANAKATGKRALEHGQEPCDGNHQAKKLQLEEKNRESESHFPV